MPFYDSNHQWTITLEEFKKDLDKFLKTVNKIHRMKLIGGEPLLVKDLAQILEYAVKKKQIDTIEITTNGTIIFPNTLIKLLKKYRKKIIVVISNYSSNKDLKNLKYNELKLQLEINDIAYLFPSHLWFERGEMYDRKRNADQLKKVFKKCWQGDCIALLDGKYHICTRAIAIQRLTKFKFRDDEYIDLRKESIKTIEKKIHKIFLKNCFGTCSFCVSPSNKRIPRAIQTTETLKINGVEYNE